MSQAHILVSGFVQGVGYRMFVRKNAEELGITGWVTNLLDGRVEALLQGRKETIEKLIERCKKGPYFSEVKNISIEFQQIEEKFEEFTIVR